MKIFKGNEPYSKNKSIVLLAGYGVFFIFVFIIFATGKTIDSNGDLDDYLNYPKEEKVENNVVNSYEYIYKIIDNETENIVTGTKTNEKETFIIEEKNYYKLENKVYLNDGTNTLVEDNIFNTFLYSYKNMEDLFKNRKTKEKTIYEDGTIKETYSINSKEYFDYMNEDKCNDVDCSNINVDVIINKNIKEQIENININLTNYYNYNYIIDINYNNINNIKEVSTN